MKTELHSAVPECPSVSMNAPLPNGSLIGSLLDGTCSKRSAVLAISDLLSRANSLKESTAVS